MAPVDELNEQALPVGATLSDGQFTITGHLGAGGFGKTYRATDNVLGRTIVIKECFPEDFCFRDGGNVVARTTSYAKPFRSIVEMSMREARSLAKLRHPNVVGVHRAFEENGTAYLALDLIDGRDLLTVIQSEKTPLPPARVRDMLLQLLDAIEKVHELDLLHRDISPDNIIIERSGTPVLIDFGAARGDASRRTRAVSTLLAVKDGYSPYEFYVAGSEQSHSSDLYALGATFYHVLCGEAPPDSQARMIEIAGRRPDPCIPLAGRVKGYDAPFLEAIDTAMQLHPGDRLQSAAAWRALISGGEQATRAAAAPVAAAPISPELERSLTRLVAETNDEVRKSQAIQTPARRTPKPPPTPKPWRPDWIEEFNKEALAAELEAAARESEAEEAETDPVLEPASQPLLMEAMPEELHGFVQAAERPKRVRSRSRKEIEVFAAKAKKRVKSGLYKRNRSPETEPKGASAAASRGPGPMPR